MDLVMLTPLVDRNALADDADIYRVGKGGGEPHRMVSIDERLGAPISV